MTTLNKTKEILNMNTEEMEAIFPFMKKVNLQKQANDLNTYDILKGFTSSVKFVMKDTINLNLVSDKVKFFSYNYAVAGAVGIVTDGIYKFLAANNIKEISLTIKDFGKEAKKGQTYIEFPKLIGSTRVTSRLGGGQMRIRVCSKYEVVEFFRRLRKLDVSALTNADLKAMKEDMQVIGRVIQEIAIDAAKNKDLSSGIDPMNTFGSIMVLSKLRAKFKTALTDNRKEVFTMARESISKNQAINTGVKVASIPDYVLTADNFEDTDHIKDWGSEYQDVLVAKHNEFFKREFMDAVKQIGTTKEDLEVKDFVMSNFNIAKEFKGMLDLEKAYSKTLVIDSEEAENRDAEDNINNAIVRKAANKAVRAAIRDTSYAIGKAYGKTEAESRKLAYGSTMLANGVVNVANVNMSSINIIGEEDMLLMWSGEQGIVRDAIEVEMSDYALDGMDFTQEIKFEAEFIDDVAYDADGEEIAYGAFDNLNCKGVIEFVNNKFMFTPEADTKLAPIGTSRVAMINSIVMDGELKSIARENRRIKDLFELAETAADLTDAKEQEDKLNKAIEDSINLLMAYKHKLYFVSKTKAGTENAVCVAQIKTNSEGKIIEVPTVVGKANAVGAGYQADLFNKGVTPREIKTHVLSDIIKTDKGLILVLSC